MNRTCKTLIQALLAGTALTQPCLLRAGELPTGATTVQGSVGIATPSANQMTIQQTTPTAIVNWQSFSVGAGSRVDISQPSASSALLNRVSGSATSTIAGQINANGQVYLINPNGILITPTGSVRAAGFVASTLDIADQDFVAGRRVFRGNGQSAAVTNQGTIEIQRGGYAALLGGRVENSGLIRVPMGRVGLGAGEQATLDLSGDGFLQVALPSKVDGSDTALIQHSGTITAAGGQVVMQAATARNAARNAINLSGLVEAHSVSGRNGAIVLGGGDGGGITVSGRLDASARTSARASTRPPARGGTITVTADNIQLKGAALLADGQAGGGTITVGGGFKGQGPLQRATTTTADAGTTISANAGQTGNGGNVVVWSDHQTNFAGQISATGGAQSGDGGQAEVSGKNLLAYTGMTDLTAPKGTIGTLLLDPYNVTISNGVATGSGFTATANDSVINVTTLQTALRTANVTVTTGGSGSPGTQAGDITVASPLTWGSGTTAPGTTLTLNAFRSIIVNANLTVNGGGGLVLVTNNGGTGGTLSFAVGASASFTAPNSNQSLFINGNKYQLVSSATDFGSLLGNPNNAAGSFALASDIPSVGVLQAPIGVTVPFSGMLEGLGHTVSGASVNTPGQFAGLFARTQGATISNLNLTGLNITGTYAGTNTSFVGGLVGQAVGTTISGVNILSGTIVNTATGASLAATGGLVGSLDGTVRQSSSAAQVRGGGGATSTTGGLIGLNSGTVLQSFATGNVNGGSLGTNNSVGDGNGSFTGGLIGRSLVGSVVTQVYANGSVTGIGGANSNSGGLIGLNEGTVNQSYATGQVVNPNSSNTTGGLFGVSTGTTTASFWDTNTTSQTVAAGNAPGRVGATGLNTTDFQNSTTFVSRATTQGWDFQTVWLSPRAGIYPQLQVFSRVANNTASNPTAASNLSNAANTPNVTTLGQGSTTPAVNANNTSTSGGGNVAVLTNSGSSGSSSSGSSSSSNGSSSGSSSSGSSSSSNGSSSGSSSSGSSSSSNGSSSGASSDNSSKPASDSASKPASDSASKPAAAAPAPQNAGNSATPSVALSALVSVQSASRVLESKFGGCNTTGGSGLPGATNCFGSALDAFADELELQAQQLPPAFRGLPAVIRQAASQVRAARTVTEARAAVRVALVAVRKAISLVRADDSDVGRIQVRQGNAIYTALETADTRLSRAVGL